MEQGEGIQSPSEQLAASEHDPIVVSLHNDEEFKFKRPQNNTSMNLSSFKSPKRQMEDENNNKIAPHHFEPMQLLGTGSFGEVYLVRKKSSGIYYAMKIQSKHKIFSNNLVKYAQTERNVLSYIEHPFIVNLNYAFQTNQKLYLIMEYCEGGDLS